MSLKGDMHISNLLQSVTLVWWTLGVLALTSMVGEPLAFAFSSRVGQVPNGTTHRCRTCHISSSGGALNPFGSAVKAVTPRGSSVQWNAALATQDSDNDGFTNGEELGDLLGIWRIGDVNPPGPVYAPGSATSLPACGNNIIDLLLSEVCDGSDLGQQTCVTQGFPEGGNLGCSATCQNFDTTACGTGNTNLPSQIRAKSRAASGPARAL